MNTLFTLGNKFVFWEDTFRSIDRGYKKNKKNNSKYIIDDYVIKSLPYSHVNDNL